MPNLRIFKNSYAHKPQIMAALKRLLLKIIFIQNTVFQLCDRQKKPLSKKDRQQFYFIVKKYFYGTHCASLCIRSYYLRFTNYFAANNRENGSALEFSSYKR